VLIVAPPVAIGLVLAAQSAGVLIASWVADDTFPPDKIVVFVPDFAPPSSAQTTKAK
jgi:hypothetical protein